MSEIEEIGSIEEETYAEKQIKWKIPDFINVCKKAESGLCSPRFTFACTLWHLRLGPNATTILGCIALFSSNIEDLRCSVEYNFGLRKTDGNIEQLGRGILRAHIHNKSPWHNIKLHEVEKRRFELTSLDVLTVICTLKRETRKTSQPSVPNELKEKKLIKLDTLSENFKKLFASKASCDTTLHVKNSEYKVHKAVLIARSSVFAAMFLHETSEKQTGIVTISDCDPESFQEFLEYLYCGTLEQLSFRSALHLYETSDKYDVQELKTFCVNWLTENLAVENICDVVILADKYDDVKLSSAAQCFFNRNLKKVLATRDWECFLKCNYRVANKLLIEMLSKVKVSD